MKKIFIILSLVSVFLVACEKPDIDPSPKPSPTPGPTPIPTPTVPIVVASGTNLNPTIASDGGNTKISFTAKESWTANVIETKSVDWIALDKTSGGAGDVTLTVTVKPNTSYDNRSAIVRLQSGSTTIDILFSQKQTDALIVAVSEINVSEDGENIEIKVEANINYSYKIEEDGTNWISYVSTKALTAKTLTFNVAANESSSTRESAITIFGDNFKHTVKISQAAKTPTLTVNQKEFEVGPEDGQTKIEVKSNVPTYFETDDEWVWFSGYDQESPDIYIFSFWRNYAYEPRTIHITFKNDEFDLSETVTITQQPSNIVEFYDQNFKNYCVKNFDTDGDENISFDEAKEVKTIEYYAETINFHGLEAFINLETLKVGSGKSDITSAQQCYMWNEQALASLTKLRHLECTYIRLNNLDLSKMPDLEYLDVEATSLYSLDVSKNKKLAYLDCSPSIYNNLQYLLLSKDQSITNVTVDRNVEYVPENTIIYIDGIATGSGNEGTMEGGEI